MTPESPPMMNMEMKPREKSRGVANRMDPPQRVPIQLKIFTPVGTAMSSVAMEKAEPATDPMPTENMCWLNTPKPKKPTMIPEKKTTGATKSAGRDSVGHNK